MQTDKASTRPFGQGLVPGEPRIGFQWFGEGEVIVFLHGVGGWRGNWFDQLLFFGQRAKAVAWDGRGYGWSDDADGPFAISGFSADLLRLLDHLGVRTAHLVGLSMGGFIAQDFYARHPSRVASLVLADTAISLRAVHGDQFVEDFLAARREPLNAGRHMADLARDLAVGLVTGGRASPAYPAAVESLAVQRSVGYLRALEAVSSFDNPLDHSGVRVPTLVLVGARDTLTPPAAARLLADSIPGARYAEIPGAGHLSNIEAPAEFNRLVADFYREALQ